MARTKQREIERNTSKANKSVKHSKSSARSRPAKAAHSSDTDRAHRRVRPAKEVVKVPKQHKWRQGTVTKRKIKKQQKSIDFFLRRGPLERLVRCIAGDMKEFSPKGTAEELSVAADGVRFTKSALFDLRTYVEDELLHTFRAGNVITSQRKCNTLSAQDMRAGEYIRLAIT